MQQQVAVGGAISITGPRAVIAAVIGNGLEWYNFMLYGVFAAIIARLYFPTANVLTSLLLSLGTFSVGFFVRPLGAAVLGAYSDRHGRKPALSLTIMLMCIGTAMIALMPTYAQIGLAAPILLMVARLMQGFSTGGEMGNATAFMREYAPERRTGYYVSWVYASSSLFIALGAAVGSVVSHGFSPEALESWGWRVPFLLGLVIGPVGYVLRTRIADPPEHRRTHEPGGTPFRDVITRHPKEAFASGALITLSTICTYTLLIYTPVYAVRALHLPQSAGFTATMVGTITAGVLIPIFGYFVDSVGPRWLLRAAPVLLFVLAYPMFAWINASPSLTTLILYQLVFGVVIAMYQGAILTGIGDMFPNRALATGLGLADNIAVSVFGGTAALMITWMIALTGSNMVPAFYIMAGAVVGLLGTLPLRR
ncbi:MAG TPA: MFS transporter [Acetobacteraceae bacterium]|nr:MFS transporter [Acetobacteraceae bacterium]